MAKDVREYSSYNKLDQINRILALSGVPLNLLTKDNTKGNINFKSVAYRSQHADSNEPPIHISIPQQTEYLDLLSQKANLLGNSLTLGMGGFPSEQPATELAIALCRLYYVANQSMENAIPLVKWIDLAYPDWDFLNTFEPQTALIVINGVAEGSDPRRIERAKDFIRKAEGSTCIYIAHTDNILKFSFEKLGITPDSVFQLGRNVVNRNIR